MTTAAGADVVQSLGIGSRLIVGALKRNSLGLGLCLAATVAFNGTELQALTANQSKLDGPALHPLRTRLKWTGSPCLETGPLPPRIEQRTDKVRFVQSGEELTLEVTLAAVAEGLQASMVLRSATKSLATRNLLGRDCSDLLNALALVAAIALDDHWQNHSTSRSASQPAPSPRPVPQRQRPVAAVKQRKPSPRATKTQPPEPVVELLATLPATEPAIERPASVPAQLPSQPPNQPAALPPTQTPPAPRPPSQRSNWRLSFGTGARVAAGMAPQWLLGVGFGARLGWRTSPPWSPHIGLRYTQYFRDSSPLGLGQIDFQVAQWGVDACPLTITATGLALSPCASFQWGSLTAEGQRVFAPLRIRRAWRTAGGHVRLEGPLGGPLRFAVVVGASVPLLRDRFGFDGESVFHRPSAIIPEAQLGLSWSLL